MHELEIDQLISNVRDMVDGISKEDMTEITQILADHKNSLTI
jgi:hypothetical protein